MSLGALDVQRSYETVVWIAWILPGVATFALLTRVLGSGWLALPGAFVALTLSAGSRSGVEEGLRWGLVAARRYSEIAPDAPHALADARLVIVVDELHRVLERDAEADGAS